MYKLNDEYFFKLKKKTSFLLLLNIILFTSSNNYSYNKFNFIILPKTGGVNITENETLNIQTFC